MKKSIALLFSLTLLGCQKKVVETQENSKFFLSDKLLKTLSLDTVKSATLVTQHKFYGKITADKNKLIEIFPVFGGNVSKVFVELGDFVEKGQLMAQIHSTQVAEFEKQLEDAKNDVLVANNDLKVVQELYEGKLGVERDLVEARSKLEKAKNHLNRILTTFEIYSIKSGAIYEVRSPIKGFVIQKNINEGMLLREDRTENIFDVAALDDVWVMANVNESDINEVKLGGEAQIKTLSYPDKIFYGKVDKIFNIIDPQTKAMTVRIKLENKDLMLKPEMRAYVLLSYKEDKKMLNIPARCIIFDKGKNFVVIYKSTEDISIRSVEVFRLIGNTAYLSGGIFEGEIVVSTNQIYIYDALTD
jgi:cobalt-zinc-cadmium efflux system membrane fusion protein